MYKKNSMKFLLTAIIIVCLNLAGGKASAQTRQMEAESVALAFKSMDGKWGDWGELIISDAQITVDLNVFTVRLVTGVDQLFDIHNISVKEEEDEFLILQCTDRENESCVFMISENEVVIFYEYFAVAYGLQK